MKKVIVTKNPVVMGDQNLWNAQLEGTDLIAIGSDPINALGWLVRHWPRELLPDLELPKGRIDVTTLLGLLVQANTETCFKIEIREK